MSAPDTEQCYRAPGLEPMTGAAKRPHMTAVYLRDDYLRHPMLKPLLQAMEQQVDGKGKARHGQVPYLEQRIFTTARNHGVGFITGQAEKKLGEAAALLREAFRKPMTEEDLERVRASFEREVLGALVYAASALVAVEQGYQP